jgi:hypothetical protein
MHEQLTETSPFCRLGLVTEICIGRATVQNLEQRNQSSNGPAD